MISAPEEEALVNNKSSQSTLLERISRFPQTLLARIRRQPEPIQRLILPAEEITLKTPLSTPAQILLETPIDTSSSETFPDPTEETPSTEVPSVQPTETAQIRSEPRKDRARAFVPTPFQGSAKSSTLTREQRMAQHASARKGNPRTEQLAAVKLEQPTASNAADIAPSFLPPEPLAKSLPPGVKEIKDSDISLSLDQLSQDLPWVAAGNERVNFQEVTLDTSGKERFLFGTYIENKRLKKALDQMNPAEQKAALDTLYVQLSQLIQRNSAPGLGLVKTGRSSCSILYAGNPQGQRIYVARLSKIDNINVILHIASCNKRYQGEVYGVISTETHRQTKKFGKL